MPTTSHPRVRPPRKPGRSIAMKPDDITLGMKAVLRTTDSRLEGANGRSITVVYYVAPDENHDEEVLPMFGVVIDGEDIVLEVWSDEIHPPLEVVTDDSTG